ncbi:MAG: cytochrome c3 family protein [Gallionellaceae bacterium]|nr:cytochrome c3 family protein [Gallionellaceae bacterium]
MIDKVPLPSWMAILILSTTLITPAWAEYADVVINKRAEQAGMRPVIFPHWFHRIRFTCNVCHNDEGFKMKVGANNITMAELVDGKFCGMCHNNENKIAWSLDRCDMCHSGLPGLSSGIQRGDPTRGPGYK